MPETEVCSCGTVKELGNAASLSMNVSLNLLEATGKSVQPKRERGLGGGAAGEVELHRPAMRRGGGSASQ